jgi:hypothetical protein
MILPIPGGPTERTQFEEDFVLATGKQAPEPPRHPRPGSAPAAEKVLRIDISHEYFSGDYLVISWEGQSEEHTHAETLEWLKQHGAKDEEKMNEAINCALNFGRSVFTIRDPKRPTYKTDPIDPKI